MSLNLNGGKERTFFVGPPGNLANLYGKMTPSQLLDEAVEFERLSRFVANEEVPLNLSNILFNWALNKHKKSK